MAALIPNDKERMQMAALRVALVFGLIFAGCSKLGDANKPTGASLPRTTSLPEQNRVQGSPDREGSQSPGPIAKSTETGSGTKLPPPPPPRPNPPTATSAAPGASAKKTESARPIQAKPTVSTATTTPRTSVRPAPQTATEQTKPANKDEAIADVDLANKRKVTVYYGSDRNRIADEASSFRESIARSAGIGGSAVAVIALLMLFWGGADRRPAILGLVVAVFVAGAGGYFWAKGRPIVATYGNDRGTFEMGTCEVTIPKTHQVGEIESPSILRLEFREDPQKHIVLANLTVYPESEFFAKMKQTIDASSLRDAFVFVHGYNVPFDDAVKRTAQIAYDLNFDGAPILFSWPSQGRLFQYTVDEENSAWAVPHLRGFLEKIVAQSGAKTIHLIAHSMGNRTLTAALRTINRPSDGPMFQEVLLTAPDIDADTFRQEIAPAIRGTAGRITLYASSDDNALKASKLVHGYPRAGDSRPSLVVVPGLDTIDVSGIDMSLLGHSYYGDSPTVLRDIMALFRERRSVQDRPWLRPVERDGLPFYVLQAADTDRKIRR